MDASTAVQGIAVKQWYMCSCAISLCCTFFLSNREALISKHQHYVGIAGPYILLLMSILMKGIHASIWSSKVMTSTHASMASLHRLDHDIKSYFDSNCWACIGKRLAIEYWGRMPLYSVLPWTALCHLIEPSGKLI